MADCHKSCLTCSDENFSSCSSCSKALYALSSNTCACLRAWQEECVGQQIGLPLRGLINSLGMLVELFLVGVAVLYLLRVRMPISYRFWNMLSGLSLLLFSRVLYLDFEEEFLLRQLFGPTNGPFFPHYRVSPISSSHIFPTLVMAGILSLLLFLLYLPITLLESRHDKPSLTLLCSSINSQHQDELDQHQSFCSSFQDYFKRFLGRFFESLGFLASRMAFFFIGLTIFEGGSSSKPVLFIIVSVVYGIIMLAMWTKVVYLYRERTGDQSVYDGPIYLYTMLSPAAMIGLPMASSRALIIVIYASPVVLLLLILLLNRNMKIFSFPKIIFYLSELVSIGLIICFIFVDNKAQTYVLLSILILCIVVFIAEGMYLTYFLAFDLIVKVHPELKSEEKVFKKIRRDSVTSKGRSCYF